MEKRQETGQRKLCETCNKCGRSVAYGSGLYVNRVLDLNTVEERKDSGKPCPNGDFLCRECDVDVESEEDSRNH